MSSIGYSEISIKAGEEFSNEILFRDVWLGLAYVATLDEVISGSKIELYIQSKLNSEIWLPLLNPTKNENASINLVKDKIIPCSPYVDGRGAKAIKFKISQIQGNDINLEIGLVKI